jgi:FSR family fosmidomycin resistance protein-like MFS transporter
MSRRSSRRPPAVAIGFLVAALTVELVDELVDGTKGAALPLIRHDLHLSYTQVGLLLAVPLLVGSLFELPVGIAAGYGARRRHAVLVGGVGFAGSVLVMAAARSFGVLLAAFVVFFPAAGAFVSLTQAELMDAEADRRDRHMAVWSVAGSLGALGGPIVVLAVMATGLGWRAAFATSAAAAGIALLGISWATRPTVFGRDSAAGGPGRSSAGDVLAALRSGEVLRWLALLQICDLLLDVLTGFVALYVVGVVHASPGWGAAAVAVRIGAGLAGEAVLVALLRCCSTLVVLLGGTLVAGAAYPGFLVLPGLAPKLAALGVLSVATAPWYPLLQARLYAALDQHSGVAVTLNSAAGLGGGLGPLGIGLVAQHFGLGPALTALAVVPPVVFCGLLIGRKHAR